MTLMELERLVRRIEQALERPAAAGELSRLAQEYASACRAAATRLQQCASMLAVGDEHQALQLAETAPALFDQLTLLAFRGSPAWRDLCAKENLPAAETFDIKPIRKLNELYAKGIDKDHALYREYRRAVMLNDDARALQILRAISRVNAADKNAHTELERLERKQRLEKGRQLEKLVRSNGDPGAIVSLMDELEQVGEGPTSAVWIDAQRVRARQIFAEAMEARTRKELQRAQEALQRLAAASNLLEENQRADLQNLQEWIASEGARRDEAARRRAAMAQLNITVGELESADAGPVARSLNELRAADESLERAWGQVERFRVEIGADLTRRVEKLRHSNRANISRRVRASRQMAFATIAAVVALCIGAAWFAYSRQSSRGLSVRLQALMSERRVAETEIALASGTNQLATTELAFTRTSVAEFLAREYTLKAAAEQALSKTAIFTNAAPEMVAANFEAARKAVSALAPDFSANASDQLRKQEARWNDFLLTEQERRTQQLAAILEPVEKRIVTDLRYAGDPGQVGEAASKLGAELSRARPLAQAPLPALRPRQEVLFRLQTAETTLARFGRDATNWFASQTALAAATNMTAYHAALQLLSENGFAPEAVRKNAAALAARNLSDRAVLEPLLLPNGPVGALSDEPRPSRVPDAVLPAEREVQRRLREDENIHRVSRVELEVKAFAESDPRRRRVAYVRGDLQRRIIRMSGEIYDPVENPSALRFVQKELASRDFTVDEPGPTAELEFYDRAGLSRLVDSNTGQYSLSLLQALDTINGDRKASPLFRAWLALRLCEIIDAQPLQWGAPWAPDFSRDRAELLRLGVGQIQSGDWFVPATIARHAAALNRHFAAASVRSYARQSAFFKRLLPRAADAGVHLVGHVNALGEVTLRDPSVKSAWGYTAADAPPSLVLQNGAPARAPMPLSPLFVYAGDARELIDSTLQTMGYAASGVGIPETLPIILRTP